MLHVSFQEVFSKIGVRIVFPKGQLSTHNRYGSPFKVADGKSEASSKEVSVTNGSRYSGMDQVKFVEDRQAIKSSQ